MIRFGRQPSIQRRDSVLIWLVVCSLAFFSVLPASGNVFAQCDPSRESPSMGHAGHGADHMPMVDSDHGDCCATQDEDQCTECTVLGCMPPHANVVLQSSAVQFSVIGQSRPQEFCNSLYSGLFVPLLDRPPRPFSA